MVWQDVTLSDCLLTLVSNNKRVMGNRVNNRFTNVVGWTAIFLMIAATFGMIVT